MSASAAVTRKGIREGRSVRGGRARESSKEAASFIRAASEGVRDAQKTKANAGPGHARAGSTRTLQSQFRCQLQVFPSLTQASAPVLPSWQITPSKGAGPQPF